MSTRTMVAQALWRGAAVLLASAGWASVGAQTAPIYPMATGPSPVQRFTYDATGRLTRAAHLAGSTEQVSLQQSWDGRGRLSSQTDGAGGVVRWQYDAAGRITSITDPLGLATRYQLGDQGLPVDEFSPDAGRTQRAFDAGGRLMSRTDARGAMSSFEYDALGRMTAATHQGAGLQPVTARWSYDGGGPGSTGVGHLTGSAFDLGAATYHHDAWGRVVQQDRTVSGVTQTVRYGYDGAGPLTSMTYPSGLTVSYLRQGPEVAAVWLNDAAGGPPIMVLDQIRGDGSGAPSSWRWGMDGQPTHRVDRDLDGRVVRHTLGQQLRTLRYDAFDRVVAMSHVQGSTLLPGSTLNPTFTYDDAGRLTRWQQDSTTVAVTYDANGNRTHQSRNGAVQLLGLEPDSNRIALAPSPPRRLQYDAAGNVVRTSAGMTLAYDAAGRLALATQAGLSMAYAYDDRGRRVLKGGSTLFLTYPPPRPVVQYTPTGYVVVLQQQPPQYVPVTTTTLYLYDDDHRLLSERPLVGPGTHREYIWLDDQLVAFVEHAAGSNAGSLAGAALYFVHSDHLNTPRVVLDRQGRTRWTWTGDPWGASAPNTNPSGLGAFTFNLRLPGQYFDAETGLAYNWHRYYDAASGRYWQSDPIGLEGGSNTYAYAGGNPMDRIDPTGEFYFIPALFGGGIGAILEISIQLSINGGRLKCINWTEVGLAGAAGAVGGAGALGAFRHSVSGKRWAESSHKWGAVRQRYGRAHDLSHGQDVHHWFFPQSSTLPRNIVNHPINLNPNIPNAINRGRFNTLGPVQRTIEGSPGWARATVVYGASGVLAEVIDDDCSCD